jgi:hypothetical protein
MAELDPRVLSVLGVALDHDTIGTQVVLLRCFTEAFGTLEWWQRMLADDPAIAALVQQVNRRTLH